MNEIKLTERQAAVLKEASKGEYQAVDDYKPVVNLVKAGLLLKGEMASRWSMRHRHYTITEAGKKWLEENKNARR